MFLITGYPRSGTTFLAKVLRCLGLGVRHEALGRDGTVSWMHAFSTEDFSPVVHVVRNPVHVFASMRTIQQTSWEKLFRLAGVTSCDDWLLNAARTWVRWNEYLEGIAAYRFRIEDFDGVYQDLLGTLQVDPAFRYKPRPSVLADVNSRKASPLYTPLCWNELPGEVCDLAIRYGYEPDLTKVHALLQPI